MGLYGCKIFGLRKKSNFWFLRFSACLSDLIVLKNETIFSVRTKKKTTNLLSVSPLFLVNLLGKMRVSTLLNFFVRNKIVALHFCNFSYLLSLVIVPRKSVSY